jgi:uncharacterized membrane protein
MTGALTTIARGDGSLVRDSLRAVIRREDEWRELWGRHAGPASAVPYVDFTARMVAAVFAGERPTPGFEVEIVAAEEKGTGLTVVVSERQPAAGVVAAQVLVTPFHIVTLPKHEGEVGFVKTNGAGPAPGPSPRSDGAEPPSSTGLSPNVAAALAYLAGPFSGALILVTERTSTYVRVHAWQAILGLGGLGLLAVVLLLGAFAALLVSPAGFTVMYRLAFGCALSWLIVWAFALYCAATGRRWHMPLVGAMAERRGQASGG